MFSCKRCGYTAIHKAHLKSHLQKITSCTAKLNDLDRKCLLDEITKQKNANYKCDRCDKHFSHLSGKYRHQRLCGSSTNKEVQLECDINDLRTQIDELKMRAVLQTQNKQVEQTEDTQDIVEQKIKPIIDGYLYIVWLREFVNSQQPVYKIGRSKDISSRFKDYPKDSKLLYCVFTTDIVEKESKLIQVLKNENSGVTQQTKYGTEYFLGDYNVIRSFIEQLV